MKKLSKNLILFLLLFLMLMLPAPSAEERDASKKKVVNFAFISLYSPRIMYEKYQPLMDYLSENTPYRFELKLGWDYKDIINYLKNGSADIALLGAATYLEAKKEFDVMPILASLDSDRMPTYRSAIVTRKDNNDIISLSDLKGKTFAFASRRSTSGYLVPLYYLYKAGVRLEDFSGYCNQDYHDAVAKEVMKGRCRVGAMLHSVALRYSKDLRIIFISDPIPGLPIVVRGNTSPEFVKSIKKAFLALSPDNPAHQKILQAWDEEMNYGFTEVNDTHFNPIREMVNYLREMGVKVIP
ncbi:MAG TPA: phosphonate ABC transporter substrate-binding protein [Deltaproteobacteria bacterium]|nr:phosphonate ABC transporter substrate-binding protein [Deltaproteobacteria bacterium]